MPWPWGECEPLGCSAGGGNPRPSTGVETVPTARSTQAVVRYEESFQTSPSTGRAPSKHQPLPDTLCPPLLPADTRVVSELFSSDVALLLRVRFPAFIPKTPSRSRHNGQKVELRATAGGFWA